MLEKYTIIDGLPQDVQTNDFINFKCAPISSLDVEWSFSLYQYMLGDNRHSLLFEILLKSLIIY